MKIKVPKKAYGILHPDFKGKWHLASNVNPEGTEDYGPKTACGMDELEQFEGTKSISKIPSDHRCLKCFAAFEIDDGSK